jgi:hypothetical protein
MNIAIFWGTAPFNPDSNQRIGRTYRFSLQNRKSAKQETSVQQVSRQDFRP